jgi:PAS domain S-box-containing protein
VRLSESLGRVRAREDFLQATLDAVADGVRVIGADHTVIRANRAFLDQTGLPSDAVVGRPCWASSHGRSEACVSTLVNCPVAELKQTGQRMKFTDRHRRGADEEMVVEVAAAAMKVTDEDGTRLFVVEAIRDLEEMAKISHEQKLSEIGQLATGVAHEIRNPLASIRLALQSAMHSIEVRDSAEAVGSLHMVDHEIERCMGITGSLLKLSTPATGGVELVAIDELIKEMMSLLAYEAEVTGIDVTCDVEAGLRVIVSDSELRMVVTNLVQNAFHAMPKGGHLRLIGRREAAEIVFFVEDDGVGIRPEDLDAIFLPFWSRRADGVRGTGLGLSICRAILKRAGGNITVSSTPGRGSRFTVRMPDADHDQAS